jgi:hypothetical protein
MVSHLGKFSPTAAAAADFSLMCPTSFSPIAPAVTKSVTNDFSAGGAMKLSKSDESTTIGDDAHGSSVAVILLLLKLHLLPLLVLPCRCKLHCILSLSFFCDFNGKF